MWREQCRPVVPDLDPALHNSRALLLNVPELAWEHICSFLGQGDLLTLRQVCRGTKAWVESPKVSRRLCVEIQNVQKLLLVLKGGEAEGAAPFSNFKIRLDNFSLSNREDFLRTFGNQIRVLEMTSNNSQIPKLPFLLACPNLESLSVAHFSFAGVSGEEELLICQERVRNLQELRMDTAQCSGPEEVQRLVGWLTNATKLKRLKLPRIMVEPQGDMARAAVSELLLPALTEAIMEERRLRSLEVLDMGNMFLPPEVDWRVDEALFRACERRGVSLINLAFWRFGQLCMENRDVSRMGRVIKGISNGLERTLGFLDPSLLANLEELTFSVGAGSDRVAGGGGAPHSCPRELHLPSLKSLTINAYRSDDELSKEDFQLLLSKERRRLSQLVLSWQVVPQWTSVFEGDEDEEDGQEGAVGPRIVSPGAMVQGAQIARNFCHLRVLDLKGWDGNWKDFRDLFQGLHLLEELTIKECKGLRDTVFLKDGHFRSLQRLRKLVIRAYNHGVSGISLQGAFALLPLRHLSVTFVGQSMISFDALQALNRSPFRNTVQYLTVQLENDEPRFRIKRFMREFPNIKKYNIK